MASHVDLGSGLTLHQPLSVGTSAWGTTPIDQHIINAKGCITEQAAHDILREFCIAHVTLFDTAEGYGGGTSEKRLGRSAADVCERSCPPSQLDEPIIMTKFLNAPWRYSHGCFERALRGSLRRLRIKCCPIYLIHSPVHWRPIEYWVEAAGICKKKGLLLTLGLSNCNAEQVRRAVAAGRKFGVPVVCNQIMFNLLDYNSPALRAVKTTCDELGVKIIAYSPIGQGLLADGMNSATYSSNRTARMMRLELNAIQPLRDCIGRICDAHGGKSMAQVALNWCIAHGTVPLIGCRSIVQARDSIGALGWKLTATEVKELDDLALQRSTLDSPRWRRAIFVTLASLVMVACKACDFFGFGMVPQAIS